MLLPRSPTLVLVLVLLRAAGCQVFACQSPDKRCDFVCDCPDDCGDEQDCGYSGNNFQCDFEAGACGWTDQSLNAYSWERRQRGDALPDSGPSSDFTTGTATGDLLLGSAPLWASVHRGSKTTVVWRPEATHIRGWREATIFLGCIPTTFQIRLNSERSEGRRGDVAIDQMEFLDCALPSSVSLPGGRCPDETLPCLRGGCVEQRQVCDGTDDCGDGTDEKDCEGFQRCDFEEGLCDWDLRSLSDLKWVRTSQEAITTSDPLQGPGRDHSNNSVSGHFLYVTLPDAPVRMDWAAFQSPLLEPTNSSHPCKMVMYTHQFGPRSGGLTVLVADHRIYPVWERGGALGDLWVKAEVEIVTKYPFQILIMAAIRDFSYGGIAVDSIVLSPECRSSTANKTRPTFPKPPKHPCTTPDKMCDFHHDCDEAEDEAKCGDFSFPEGSSGWTDTSVGSQGWVLHENSTTKEEHLYVAKAPGQQLTKAQTRTPLLGPSGPACTLSFDFALTGNPDHIGELSVRVIDSLLGVLPKLWEFSGKTGTGEGEWKHTEVPVGVRKQRFQLVFEARALNVSPDTKIKVKSVHFSRCHADYFPSSSTGLSCNFENGLCGWYQDNSDNFDWTIVEGMDHTIGIGRSLVVDVWSSSLRGLSGRLLSYPQIPGQKEQCLSFFYKLFGPNTGALNVKLLDLYGFEKVLWTHSGAHGNMWHEAHCPVPHQLIQFQLMFEVVRSGFDGRVAIDDVVLMAGPCTVPRMCSFESQQCGYKSLGQSPWLHRNGHSVGNNGPRVDHTLETELGFYMMVNTRRNFLPSGGNTVLISPVRQGTAKTECLHFWYHMGGKNPGSLTVYMKPVKGKKVKLFSNGLDQGDVWRHGNADISSALVDWQLEFEVIGAGGEDTHIAIDDVALLAHPCENQGSKCSLEKGMCSWNNIQNPEMDELDWDLTSKEADSHYLTPPEDHTTGTEKGHFLFLPSSNRTAANQNALLLSPHLPPTKGTCLRFWAYKKVSSDSQLKVWRMSGGTRHQLLEVKELQGLWKRFDVDIMSTEEYQILLEGIKGTSGVVALDDIEYTVGIDCAKKVTDPLTKPPKGDNSGGMGASIIVVLLLIATLITLLFYYLRTQQAANPPPSMGSPSASSAGAGFSNESYEPDLTEDRVTIPPAQNHPMAAGFNNVPVSADFREMEVV